MVPERTRPLGFPGRLSVVGRVDRLLAGKAAGLVRIRAGASAPPTQARLPAAGSAAVQQCRPRKRLWQGGHFAKHDLDDVTDRVGGIFGPPRTFQPAIDEQLQQIESQRPKQQDGQQSIRRVSKHMGEIPVLDPLVEGGILEVPASTTIFSAVRRDTCAHVDR